MQTASKAPVQPSSLVGAFAHLTVFFFCYFTVFLFFWGSKLYCLSVSFFFCYFAVLLFFVSMFYYCLSAFILFYCLTVLNNGKEITNMNSPARQAQEHCWNENQLVTKAFINHVQPTRHELNGQARGTAASIMNLHGNRYGSIHRVTTRAHLGC